MFENFMLYDDVKKICTREVCMNHETRKIDCISGIDCSDNH